MKKISFLLMTLMLSFVSMQAATEVATCNGAIGNGDRQVYLSWNTVDGNVVITLTGQDGDPAAAFRGGNGMNNNGFKVNGEAITNLFNKTYTQGSNTIVWTPKDHIDQGAQITFNASGENQQIEWTTKNGDSNSNAYSFTYIYGDNACAKLPAPEDVAITKDGVLTFDADEDAAGNIAYVYYNGSMVTYQKVVSGDKINLTSYSSKTYQVYVRSLSTSNDYQNSDLSEAVNWTPAVAPIPASSVCAERVGNGNDNYMCLTFETDAQGNINITMSDYGNNANATFRGGNGMNPNGFKCNGQPMTNYFDKGWNTADHVTVLTWKPKTGDNAPQKGDIITFNKNGEQQQIEWYIGSNGKNGNQYSFEYVYGSTCPGLDQPVISNISADSVITFASVAGAESYTVIVYLNGSEQYKQDNVTSGETIHFSPLLDGTYDVVLIAHAEGMLDAESEPYKWALTAPEIVLGNSEYCGEPIGNGNTQAFLTWITDAEGNVVISISGDDGTKFRGGNGMNGNNLDKFTVGTQSASNFFTRDYAGDNSLTFTLKLKDGAVVAPGTKIKYNNGTIEWKTSANNNCYGGYTFEYTYGTTCPSLVAPVITSIDASKVITFSAVENAESYSVAVYRGNFPVYQQDSVVSGGTVNFAPYVEYDYTVYLTAKAEGLMPATSEGYTWHLAASGADLPLSEVCSKEVKADDGGIYLTAETDAEGRIVFTLSGENNPVWRGGGLQVDMLTIYGDKLQNYFDKKGEDGTSGYAAGTAVFTMVPRSDIPVHYGDVITYKGNVEWTVVVDGQTNNPWVGNYEFTYVYGSKCTADLPRLETPVITSITNAGNITFNAVENAASYKAYVYDADEEEISQQTVVSGAAIDAGSTIVTGFTYYVRLQALPEEGSTSYRESLLSEAVAWEYSKSGTAVENVLNETLYDVYTTEGLLLQRNAQISDIHTDIQTGVLILRGQDGSVKKIVF